MQNIVLIFNKILTNQCIRIFDTFTFKMQPMAIGVGTFNSFLFFKVPAAWWCGVRLRQLDQETAVTSVRYRWINQNPFKSMFWAVQGMAAEISTGAMVMDKVRRSNKNISMLVARNRAEFTRKATGKITFRCEDGKAVAVALEKAIRSGEGQTIWMTSTGVDEEGAVVSVFEFEWSLKVRR